MPDMRFVGFNDLAEVILANAHIHDLIPSSRVAFIIRFEPDYT